MSLGCRPPCFIMAIRYLVSLSLSVSADPELVSGSYRPRMPTSASSYRRGWPPSFPTSTKQCAHHTISLPPPQEDGFSLELSLSILSTSTEVVQEGGSVMERGPACCRPWMYSQAVRQKLGSGLLRDIIMFSSIHERPRAGPHTVTVGLIWGIPLP